MNDPIKNWDAMRNVPLAVKIIGGIGMVLPFLPIFLVIIFEAMGKSSSGGLIDIGNLIIFSSVIIGAILIPPSIHLLKGYRWALWFFRFIFSLMILISLAGISSFGLFSLPFGFIGLFLLQKNKLYFQK